jgi:signal transduction histidine kinase
MPHAAAGFPHSAAVVSIPAVVNAAPDALDERALRRLLDAGRALVADLDLEAVLGRVVRAAAEITGARYAALGILDERREGLANFLTHGVDETVHRAIGDLPRGRGILGVLIHDPRPLRLNSVGDDPRSYGFPAGHPPMATFLGAPVLVRGEAWGNLYLTEKAGGGPFTQADEDAAVVLAEWAGVAIENARLYEGTERRREELERVVRRLEATTTIAHAVGGETDLDRILELIVKRGRALVDAAGVVILLRQSDGLVVAAVAGEVPASVRGSRVAGDAAGVRASLDALGLAAGDSLLVPLVFRGQSLGMLAAFGARGEEDDERLLHAFAASAATAVGTARRVEEQRLRDTMQAAEEERKRWARELHDDTLQGLGALRVLLVGARRAEHPERLRDAVDEAVVRLEDEIAGLRGLVRELRPAALDELGVAAAIEGLADRFAGRYDVDVEVDMSLGASGTRYAPEVETALYRIVQEALNNAARHSGAERVRIQISETDGALQAQIVDDGAGFDPEAPRSGFGLAGMRERVVLLNGELEIASSADGTRVSAALPVG